MKVLLLLPQLPVPPDQGASIRNYGLLRILAEEHELNVLCFADQPPEQRDLDALHTVCRSVRVIPSPRRGALARGVRLLTSGVPDLALRRGSPAFARALRELLASQRFDVVHVSNLEMALYFRNLSGSRRVFDDHNAEYVLQRRAFETDVGEPTRLPPALYSLVQWRRLRAFEAWACRNADLVLAVSGQDAERLSELGPGIRPRVVPNGVDLDRYSLSLLPEQQRPFLLFSGKLDYRPNQDAVRWFLDHVLPLVWRSHPDTRFLVVGHAPPRWLVERCQHDVRVVVTGAVRDDRPYLERSSVYVLPMRWGGGVRFKALVALATGRPLVSTTLGVDGLDCVPGEHALVADEPEVFAELVVQVLRDRALAMRLVQAGRSLVEQRFAWPRIAPVLLDAYRSLAAGQPRYSHSERCEESAPWPETDSSLRSE